MSGQCYRTRQQGMRPVKLPTRTEQPPVIAQGAGIIRVSGKGGLIGPFSFHRSSRQLQGFPAAFGMPAPVCR